MSDQILMNQEELQREQAYAAMVQHRLLELMNYADDIAKGHKESVRAIISDAWEDLRMRPTALSPQDLEQLSTEVDRFLARKKLVDEDVRRYGKMLKNPFFARVDFREEGEENPEKFVIGLHSLKNEQGDLVVFDWRAPVSNLYYDALPGECGYRSPSGDIRGEMTLKRQYKIKDGLPVFYADTSLSIDDDMLLDVLSASSTGHMRQIISSIQSEQNAAIRHDAGGVLSVVGGAGSGKTSVAMHRAAYLMYHTDGRLNASRIQILSPGSAFSEYISGVLPELGEENIRAATLREIVSRVLGRHVEDPADQLHALLGPAGEERRESVCYKGGADFLAKLEKYAAEIEADGPEFFDIPVSEQLVIRKEELAAMYRGEFSGLSVSQKLERMRQTLDTRMERVRTELYRELEQEYSRHFKGKELRKTVEIALLQKMQPVLQKVRENMGFSGKRLLRRLLKAASERVYQQFVENTESGFIAWEDAVAEAYLAVRLGFAQPDKSVYHLLIDEAQDYTETALRFLKLYYPAATVTVLGDPMQRTQPGLPACDPAAWGRCFGADAPIVRLTKCYRSTRQIAEFCAKILPESGLTPVGRDGEAVKTADYEKEAVAAALADYRAKCYRSIAVITRSMRLAEDLSRALDGVYRLDGGDADGEYKKDDTVVGCYHMMKGLEFDAVIVVWDEGASDFEERRRLYTACTRALHALSVFGGEEMIGEIGR